MVFVPQQEIVEASFDGIRLDGFLDFRDTILLSKVETLVSDEKSCMITEEFTFDSTNRSSQVDVGRVVSLKVIEKGLDIGGYSLLAIDLAKGIDCINYSSSFDFRSIQPRHDGICPDPVDWSRSEILERLRSKAFPVDSRDGPKASCILARRVVKATASYRVEGASQHRYSELIDRTMSKKK